MYKFKTILSALLFVSLTAIFPMCTVTGDSELSPEEFRNKIQSDDVKLIDVRTPEEIRKTGRIHGAININFNSEDFESKLDELDQEKTIMLYCRTDNRSGAAASYLNTKGNGNVQILKGGIIAWEKAGYDTDFD